MLQPFCPSPNSCFNSRAAAGSSWQQRSNASMSNWSGVRAVLRSCARARNRRVARFLGWAAAPLATVFCCQWLRVVVSASLAAGTPADCSRYAENLSTSTSFSSRGFYTCLTAPLLPLIDPISRTPLPALLGFFQNQTQGERCPCPYLHIIRPNDQHS